MNVLFSLPVQMHRESYCATPALALVGAVAAAWTKCLSFTLKFLCDWQSAVRRAILYTDRSCYNANALLDIP